METAQKQGEEGNIDESEKIMLEVEKMRQNKKELEDRLLGKVPTPQDAQGPGNANNDPEKATQD